MSSSSPMQPLYAPISFVSPISETTRRNPNSTTSPNEPIFKRLSTYIADAFTLEDEVQATRRASIISDHMGREAETIRRASIVSTQDQQQDQALQQWRRQSVDGFWSKYGSVSEDGARRKSIVEGGEGETFRRQSVGGSTREGKFRKMSWGVKQN
ncbi:hypothetical protein CC86DRAFT_304769 [Ophiobolus disseminans]|uniref:Uncharacterized protein n=1 Tax=Ophiobolus disseminans TaxID=1469910 RepID=A0A6A6ZJY7_9PLEO|nr:hypothetical protein CC86DRAFT_304769 [Ophiobolus disseminans]